MRVTTTGTVTGRFRMPGAAGAPIPLGTVTLVAGGRTIGRVTTESAGDVGRYRFEYVPAGTVRVEAQDPLTGRTGFNAGTLATQGEELPLDVVAQAIGRVFGTVTLNDAGVPQARVEVVSGSYKALTFADEDGDYALCRRAGGPCRRDRDPQRGRPRRHRLGHAQRRGPGAGGRRRAARHRAPLPPRPRGGRRSSGGVPVDASAVFADGTPIDGVAGLRAFVLKHQDSYVHTFVSKLLTYALGRHVDYHDQPAIRRILRDAAPGGYRWSAIIRGIVTSTPFQMGKTAS